MLIPDKDRSDYGIQLQPPAGFTLDAAIATTYSLDLDTLLVLPIALCFSDTLEGNLHGEKIAVLEALSQLEDRLVVFYQTGNIHIPPSFNRLFTLLEPFLSAVTPHSHGAFGAYTSFHPKLWLLRFRRKENPSEVCYRLLVLSRNITFDRSWDVAASIDGFPEPGRCDEDDSLSGFLQALAPHAGKSKRPIIEQLASEVPGVRWILPGPFSSMKMLPGGAAHCLNRNQGYGTPLDFGRALDELIVVSPFLDIDALDNLAAQSAEPRYLFSRADSLDTLGEQALVAWQCYSMNDAVLNGEERRELPNAEVQDLHAKLFISKSGKTTHWHVGSANATNAALGSASGASPRNTEFMLRLSTTNLQATPASLLAEWTQSSDGNLFIRHTFTCREDPDEEKYATALRQLSYQLISAKWYLRAEPDDNLRYSLHMRVEPLIVIPAGFVVQVGMLCIPGHYDRLDQVVEQQITWLSLALTQISAFIPIRVIGPLPDITASLVMQAALTLPREVDRSGAVLRELVDTPDKLMNYIRLLLHADASKEQWDGADEEKIDGNGGDLFGFDLSSGLLEQLLLAASRRPEQLTRVDQLIKRMRRMGVPVPEEFQSLWKHFRGFAKDSL